MWPSFSWLSSASARPSSVAGGRRSRRRPTSTTPRVEVTFIELGLPKPSGGAYANPGHNLCQSRVICVRKDKSPRLPRGLRGGQPTRRISLGRKSLSRGNIFFSGHVRRVLLNQKLVEDEKPLGSQFFTLASTCSPSPLHPSMTLRSAKSAYSGYSANRNGSSCLRTLITEYSWLSGCSYRRMLVELLLGGRQGGPPADLFELFGRRELRHPVRLLGGQERQQARILPGGAGGRGGHDGCPAAGIPSI